MKDCNTSIKVKYLPNGNHRRYQEQHLKASKGILQYNTKTKNGLQWQAQKKNTVDSLHTILLPLTFLAAKSRSDFSDVKVAIRLNTMSKLLVCPVERKPCKH